MKNTKTLAIALSLVAGVAAMGSAQAQSMYAGVAYSTYNIDPSVKPSAATLKVGYVSSPNLAIEGRVALPMGDGSIGSVNIKVESHYGIYAKGMLPLNEMFTAYGLLGYNSMSIKASAGGFSASSGSKSGSSYGLGLDAALTKEISVNAEWAQHMSDVSSMSFGVSYKF